MAWFDKSPERDAPAEPVLFSENDPSVQVESIDFGARFGAHRALPEPEPAPGPSLADLAEASEAEQVDWQARIEEAYERGRAEAEGELDARLAEALAEQRELQERRWLAALDVMAEWQAARVEELSHAVLELSGALTRHFVGREVREDEDAYREIVEQAMRRAFEYDELRIHVPEDAVAGLEARVEGLKKRHPQHTSLKIIGDETLEPGDCAIVSQGVRVEGLLAERVAQLVDAARSALEHEHALTPQPQGARSLADDIDAVDGRGLAEEMLSEPTEAEG